MPNTSSSWNPWRRHLQPLGYSCLSSSSSRRGGGGGSSRSNSSSRRRVVVVVVVVVVVFEDVGGWYLVGFRVAGSGVSGLTQGWSAFLKRGGFLGVQGFGAWGCGAFAWGMLKA